jgi:capsid protein
VDPKKDAESAAILLGLRLTTRGRLLAAQGEDLEETLRQVADEEALAAELGVSLETEPPKQQKEDPDADAA